MKLTNLFGMALLFASFHLEAQPSPSAVPESRPAGRINSAQFSADGKHLITTSSNVVQVWDTKDGKPIQVLPSHMGTWRLSSFKYGEDTKWSDAPADQKRLKLITDTHFTWVAYEAPSGKLLSMAGGTYTLSGNSYSEKVDYAGEGMGEYVHKQQIFTLRLEGDKLHQIGQLSDGTKIEEIWERVK